MTEPTKHIHNGVLTYGGNRVGHSSDIDAHREGRHGQHVEELAQSIADFWDDGPVSTTDLELARHIIREYARKATA